MVQDGEFRLDDPGDKNFVFRCSCQEGNGSPRRTGRESLYRGLVLRFHRPFVARPVRNKKVRDRGSSKPREPGPVRWARWARMLDEGTYGTRAELSRGEGVSRAAVTLGLGKLRADRSLDVGTV